jgi:hypothetical protein
MVRLAARHSSGDTPVSTMMKLGRTELFGMGIALAWLAIPLADLLARMPGGADGSRRINARRHHCRASRQTG